MCDPEYIGRLSATAWLTSSYTVESFDMCNPCLSLHLASQVMPSSVPAMLRCCTCLLDYNGFIPQQALAVLTVLYHSWCVTCVLRGNCCEQELNDEGKLGVGGGGHTKYALNPKKKLPFKLKEKIMLSHNTRLFRFALQSPEHRLGLPIGQHMFFYAKVSPVT